VVLAAAVAAAVGELSGGHRDERPVRALDDLQVADDELVVERDRAEGLQLLVGVLDELHPDLRDVHERPSPPRDLSARSTLSAERSFGRCVVPIRGPQ
jgi:hypothetical protein